MNFINGEERDEDSIEILVLGSMITSLPGRTLRYCQILSRYDRMI